MHNINTAREKFNLEDLSLLAQFKEFLAVLSVPKEVPGFKILFVQVYRCGYHDAYRNAQLKLELIALNREF